MDCYMRRIDHAFGERCYVDIPNGLVGIKFQAFQGCAECCDIVFDTMVIRESMRGMMTPLFGLHGCCNLKVIFGPRSFNLCHE